MKRGNGTIPFPRPRILLPVLLAAGLALAASVAVWGDVSAQPAFSIQGSVVNGTDGGEPPQDLLVLMLVSSISGDLVFTGRTHTDGSGQFRFDMSPEVEHGVYSFRVEYAGVVYNASRSLEDVQEGVTLNVFETTLDLTVLRVLRQVIVIVNVDETNQRLGVVQFVRLVNNSDRTLTPDLSNPGQMSFLRFSLPPQAQELSVESNLPSGDIISVGTGFALTSAVTPGDHSIEYSFLVPYSDETLLYRLGLHQGADFVQVLVLDRFSSINVQSMTPTEAINIEGTLYRAWESTDFESGQGLSLELSGLPQRGVLARLEHSITRGAFWQVAIPSALGAVLAILLILGATTLYRGGAIPEISVANGGIPDFSGSEEMIRELASLDEQFHRGELLNPDYQQRRQDLKRRVLDGLVVKPDDAQLSTMDR